MIGAKIRMSSSGFTLEHSGEKYDLSDERMRDRASSIMINEMSKNRYFRKAKPVSDHMSLEAEML